MGPIKRGPTVVCDVLYCAIWLSGISIAPQIIFWPICRRQRKKNANSFGIEMVSSTQNFSCPFLSGGPQKYNDCLFNCFSTHSHFRTKTAKNFWLILFYRSCKDQPDVFSSFCLDLRIDRKSAKTSKKEIIFGPPLAKIRRPPSAYRGLEKNLIKQIKCTLFVRPPRDIPFTRKVTILAAFLEVFSL